MATSAIMTAHDETEDIRRRRLANINRTVENGNPTIDRQRLEEQYGHVWDTAQLVEDFEVLGFMAPYIVVRRKSDGRKGSLEFQHMPRFYFNFALDQPRTLNRYTHKMESHDDNSDLWEEPIHVYTRAQAIADGILVDLTTATDDRGQLLCPQAGFKVPIAITRTAWAKAVEAGGTWKHADAGETLELKGGQSLTGRLWDLLCILKLTCGRTSNTDRVHFQVLLDVLGDGHRELVKLWALCGPGDDARPVITIMLEGED